MKEDFYESLKTELREFYAHYYQHQQDKEQLAALIKDKPDSLKSLSEVPPWSHLYELSFKTFLALGILEFNLTEIIQHIAQSGAQLQSFSEQMNDSDNVLDLDEVLSDEEKGFRISLTLATINQMSSISMHSQPLSTLVEKIRLGDDNALFDAVLVDRSIVSSPTVAHRIQIAQLMEDGNFMELLSKAIKRSRPKRPEKGLDDLRYMLEVLDGEIGLENITHNKLYDILSVDLELYGESIDGFKKIIQRRNKRHRT